MIIRGTTLFYGASDDLEIRVLGLVTDLKKHDHDRKELKMLLEGLDAATEDKNDNS